MLFGTPSLLSFQFFVIVFYTCIYICGQELVQLPDLSTAYNDVVPNYIIQQLHTAVQKLREHFELGVNILIVSNIATSLR